MNNVPIPSPEAMREFLRAHYRHDRFEGRDPAVWGTDYWPSVVRGAIDDLRTFGHGFISRHDSNTGQVIWYGPRLEAFDSYDALVASWVCNS